MIERATERRLAGDWPGACAAAACRPVVNLDSVRHHHGAEVADRLAEDLRHLAPDLLRWHIGPLRPRRYLPLALYPHNYALVARTPEAAGEPPWIRLSYEPLQRGPAGQREDVMLLLRDRWDVRCTAEKLPRSGGLTRLPFYTATGERLPPDALGADTPEGRVERAVLLDDAGRHAEAWAVAGWDLHAPHARSLGAFRPVHATLEDSHRRVLAYAAEARRCYEPPPPSRRPIIRSPIGRPFRRPPKPRADPMEWDERSRQACLNVGGRWLILEGRHAHLYARGDDDDLWRMPRIPRGVAERPPELAALLRGDLEPAQLHPLAHAALFPAAAPIAPAPAPAAPLREAIQVRCHGETHEIRVDGGFVTPHSGTELDRERMIGALGGGMRGCAAAVEGWRNPALRRIPRPLVSLRIEFLRRFADADTAAVAQALDRGFDPHLRDERGRTLLHRLAWLPGADLLPRLLAAGLDLQEPDRQGRTPLQLALECGSPELVRALRAAGAK